jgi:hypothetical protein
LASASLQAFSCALDLQTEPPAQDRIRPIAKNFKRELDQFFRKKRLGIE